MSMIGKSLSHYKITSLIGKGGIGEVYHATDTKLGRDVAIKVLHEEFSHDADRIARFQREAKLLASLNHPNIAAIHGLEESDGTHFLVLELIEGDTLAGRIKGGPIPVEEALKLTLQIAEALKVAHEKGVIHRDLKPSNIMVSDKGTVKLLDFGLAKLFEQDQSISNLPTADFPATHAGVILGTAAYMSPEQAQGQPVDARSDIFSFGLVLYEMLSGRRAFSGDSNYAVMDAIVEKEPPSLQTSSALERIVKRCLEKNPTERYQRMSEVKVALVKATAKKMTVSSEEPQPSIAVLPFVNMSGDKEQEYFSDGLAEEIINALTKIPGLLVIARTSAFAFKGKNEDIRRIAKVLGVANILEGSLRKSGNRIRVTAQLIDASSGGHLWSERYDRELTDIFEIQDEISQAISEKLTVQFSGDQQLVKRPTENIEAYNFYLKGRYHISKMRPEGWAKSKEYYEQALAIDPKYALAWYGLAYYFGLLGYAGLIPSGEAHKQSRHAILKSLEFDEKLPEAHSILGEILASEFDWENAEREFHRALALNPRSSDVLYRYSLFYLLPMQRFDEALESSRKALEQDPLLAHLQANLGRVYLFARQYDRAIEQFKNALEFDPNILVTYTWIGQSYFEKGEHEEGIRVFKKFIKERTVPTADSLGLLGYTYGKAGFVDEAKRSLEELQDLAHKSHVPAYYFALVYFGLGEVEKGFDWLNKSADEHESLILHLPFDPLFDPLRSHPRYRNLLRKMNLES